MTQSERIDRRMMRKIEKRERAIKRNREKRQRKIESTDWLKIIRGKKV